MFEILNTIDRVLLEWEAIKAEHGLGDLIDIGNEILKEAKNAGKP